MSALPAKYEPALLDKLSPRERAFIEHPLVLINAEQAARDVGYSESWARSSAAVRRKQLLYYILPEAHKRWEAKGVTLDRIHEELSCIAFSDETEFYERVEIDGEPMLIGKEPTLLPETMRRAIEQINTTAHTKSDGTTLQMVGYVLHDKKVALKMLAEMLGGFDPRTRAPQDAEERRKQAELFEYMKPEEIETLTKIYRRAEKRMAQASSTEAEIVSEKKAKKT